MQKPRALLPAILLALLISAPAFAADKVALYTTWDNSFFYAAFDVQDPNVVSTNSTHMSNPWEDDDVEVFLETDGKRAITRSMFTYQMAVSAAGGSSFIVGRDGVPTPKRIFSFKYSRRVVGTMNNGDDKDLGYTIELAIPWKEMGGYPVPGQVMGFNAICRMKGETQGFVSLSPDVKSEEDVQSPAKWTKIKFSDTPGVLTSEDGAFVCRKSTSRPPTIDGNLSPGEWNRGSVLQLSKDAKVESTAPVAIVNPDQPKPADTGATTTPPTAVTTTPPAEAERYMVPKLVLSHYFYWYQGDPRKDLPAGHIVAAGGRSELTDHPQRGVGPWFSSDRVQWHKEELADVRNAGIDVIIPVYWGSAGDKRAFASKGLNCMVQALKELKAEGQSYPLVGMFFDTTAMVNQYGANSDLRDPEVKETFYGMIKDFFLQIPEEFRATAQFPVERGGGPGYIVTLYTSNYFSDQDGSFVDYCNKRFAADFGGRRLIWTGAVDFCLKAPAMDGHIDYGAGLGLKYDARSWIRMGAIGAGFDNSAVAGSNAAIRSRMGGETYENDWDTILSKPVDWLVVDGWNELHEASDVCASMEYGDRYISRTRLGVVKFNGLHPFDARYLRHDTPSTMLPANTYQVTLTVKNVGAKPWYAREMVYLAARWYKDGRLFADSGARLPIQENALAGRTLTRTMGIRTVDDNGDPLPEGDYELRWDMCHGHDEWFSSGGSVPLRVQVKIGNPTPGYTLVSTTAPALMKSGAEYEIKARVRNDGPTAWKAGAAKILASWYKVSVHLAKDSADEAVDVKAQPVEVTLPTDVAPGRVVDVTAKVRTTMADGSPIPVWQPSDLWTYMLQWRVADGDTTLAPAGIGCASEAIKVVADDLAPQFISNDTPPEMSAGRGYNVNLVVKNAGVDTWAKAGVGVGYHWYYLDGTEAQWDGAKTPLPKDMTPGEQTTMKTKVTAPKYDGQYYLVFDLAQGDKYASTMTGSRGGDTVVTLVNVTDGALAEVDLDKLYDTDIESFDTNPKDGDADGAGATLPAEFMPPLNLGAASPSRLYPSGLWATSPDPNAAGRISFRFPLKSDGVKNAITCKGQTIPVRSGKYRAAHILAMSTQETQGDFSLVYGSSSAAASTKFTAWGEAPKFGEQIGFMALHRNSPSGDIRSRAYLNDYALATDTNSKLTAITLPNNPAVKVIAITLEK